MAQTLCIKCGSELKPSSYCQLCQQPLIFTCTSCEYITEEKVHPDCRNAEVLAKPAATIEQAAASTATNTTTASSTSTPPTIAGNQQESIVDKPKEEVNIAGLNSAPSYTTRGQDNDKNNIINPFSAGAATWQSLMTYWMYTYGELFKNALKMTEDWYNIFYKPWVNWMPQQQLKPKIDND